MDEVEHVSTAGVSFAKPSTVDMAPCAHKDKVIGKLTGGLAGMAKGARSRHPRLRPSSTRTTSKSKKPPAPARTRPARRSSVQAGIIAAGSPPCTCPSSPRPAHRRLHRRAGAALRAGKMLVIGGGIIGLEMATVYSPSAPASTWSK
jgi:dihydrolipoamide dehydrogenase